MAQEVGYTVSLHDRFSRVGAKLNRTFITADRSMKKLNTTSSKSARALAKVGAAAKKAATKFKALGKAAKAAGKKLSIGLTLPLAGMAVFALKAAGDAEEMESKLSTVFGNTSEDMREWADNLGVATNRGSTMLRGMASDFGDFLKGLDFSGEGLDTMTKNLVTMTQDLGSFKNVEPERVFLALQGAMVGNFESLKTLGIAITANDVQERALLITGKKRISSLTKQEKAIAATALIQERSSDSIGDAAKTAGSFTNEMIGLKGAITDTAVKIGNKLIPVVLPMIKGFRKFLDVVKNLSPRVLKFGLIIGGLIAVVGPLLIIFGFMVPLFTAVGVAIAFIGGPILIAIAAIVAIIAVVTIFSDEILAVQDAVFGFVGGAITAMIDGIVSLIDWMGKLSFSELISDFTSFLSTGAGKAISAIFGISGEAGEAAPAQKLDIAMQMSGNVTGADVKTSATATLNTGRAMTEVAA